MVSDTVIGIMFFKTVELPPIIQMTKIEAEIQNGGHDRKVHI